MICVIVEATDPSRIADALRAAVGLGLRGDRVEVLLGAAARDLVDAGKRPEVARASAVLGALGHAVADAEPALLAAAVRRATAVEVWT